jgi:hypothetical protein
MPLNFTDKSFWNAAFQINGTNVTTVGEINAMLAAAGVPVNYGSQQDLGKRIALADSEVAAYQNTANGTLYGAVYQLVYVDPGATAANVKTGTVAFLVDKTPSTGAANSGALVYAVSDQSHADSTSLPAGIFLNSITPGNYGFIAVHGKVNALFTTIGTAGIGAGVFVGATGNGTVDTGSAAVTMATIGTYLGNAIVAPVTLTQTPIQMKTLLGRY